MKTLAIEESESVSGGIMYLAALGFVWHEARNIRDFIDGVLDGWGGM
jgi:hypothetical protein